MCAAILENDACIVHDYATPEAHIVTLNERDDIALSIGRAEIDRIAVETAGCNRWLRSHGIDKGASLCEVVRIDERSRIDAHVRWVGKIGIAVRKGQFLRLDGHVNCVRCERAVAER